MIGLSQGWSLQVDRGPDWLFVRPSLVAEGDGSNEGGFAVEHCAVEEGVDDASLADSIWSVIEQHFTYRVVVECEQLGRLTSDMIAQLLTLNRRIRGHGGTLRLCGLSDDNQEALRQCRIDGFFPRFSDRSQAVLGNRPWQPR
ncbi:MAG TPA: STAS domain-containing protein [Pirellulales bacterium]|nr:STAS domain-containing protein [Pirellulales bacterium]